MSLPSQPAQHGKKHEYDMPGERLATRSASRAVSGGSVYIAMRSNICRATSIWLPGSAASGQHEWTTDGIGFVRMIHSVFGMSANWGLTNSCWR